MPSFQEESRKLCLETPSAFGIGNNVTSQVIEEEIEIKTTSTHINIFRQILTGHRLTGNVIREMTTLNLLECALYCIIKPSEYKSINYRASNRQDYSINCQLINATKTTHPRNLLADANYNNYEPTMEKVFCRFSLT